MKRQRKTYEAPMKKWDLGRIEAEAEITKKFGLKNKTEIWKAKTIVSGFRKTAKSLFSQQGPAAEKKKKELITKLVRYGLLSEGATLDDVLPITADQLLARQLQFIVKSKGLASSPLQARQLITHSHIAVGDARVTRPSYLVSIEEEPQVKYAPTSPVAQPGHPIRELPKASLKDDTQKALSEINEKKVALEAAKVAAEEVEKKEKEEKAKKTKGAEAK